MNSDLWIEVLTYLINYNEIICVMKLYEIDNNKNFNNLIGKLFGNYAKKDFAKGVNFKQIHETYQDVLGIMKDGKFTITAPFAKVGDWNTDLEPLALERHMNFVLKRKTDVINRTFDLSHKVFVYPVKKIDEMFEFKIIEVKGKNHQVKIHNFWFYNDELLNEHIVIPLKNYPKLNYFVKMQKFAQTWQNEDMI